MEKLWNELPVKPEDVQSLGFFEGFLNRMDWKIFDLCFQLFSRLSDYFVDPRDDWQGGRIAGPLSKGRVPVK